MRGFGGGIDCEWSRRALGQVHLSRDGVTMIVRNLESRLVKLETRTARPNEMLVVWRKPGVDIRSAVVGQQFASGDKVICPEWTGEAEPPAPKWHRDRLSRSMTDQEYDCVLQSIQHTAEAGEDGREDAGLAPFPRMSGETMRAMSDNDLIHAVLGVQT
jgi:hypothetical protein